MDDATTGPGSFAALLRRYRERSALSQEELATRAGVARIDRRHGPPIRYRL